MHSNNVGTPDSNNSSQLGLALKALGLKTKELLEQVGGGIGKIQEDIISANLFGYLDNPEMRTRINVQLKELLRSVSGDLRQISC